MTARWILGFLALLPVVFGDPGLVRGEGEGQDPRVHPGAQFTVDYPDLPQTLACAPSVMHVFIPEDYDPARKHPLFLWLNVGTGPPGTQIAQDITENKRFVCVSLPLYRTEAGMAKPGIQGIHLEDPDGPLIWAQYCRMLDDLDRIVPNLHPTRRLVGGGSNGAHAIGLLANLPDGGFRKRFHAYFLWEGGYTLRDFASISGRPLLACWGDRSLKDRLGALAAQARAAKVDVETIEMPGVGHEFPPEYYPKFRDWIDRKVVYGGLPEAAQALEAGWKAKRWDAACRALRDVLERADETRPEWGRAQEALKALSQEGARALDAMKAKEQSAVAWRRFARDWAPCPCAEEAREACLPLGQRDLEAARAQTGGYRVAALRKFLADWEGFPVREEALALYEEEAKKALETADVSARSASSRAPALQRFIREWKEVPSAADARERLEALAAAELEKLRAKPSASRLEEFLKRFEGTRAAEEARRTPLAGKDPKKAP